MKLGGGSFPKSVELFEVGPRDGLQNEDMLLPLEKKLEYIEALIAAGVTQIEVGSFVREDRVPQMAHTDEIFKALAARGYLKNKKLNLWALVPNEKGFERALEVGCKSIAVFTGATETFTQKNIGMSIQQSLDVFKPIIKDAKKRKIKVRGYVSVCWGCPYEGKVKPQKVIALAKQLLKLGVDQVSLGDTIGVATPAEVVPLLSALKSQLRSNKVAVHFHDTRGTALANVLAALTLGVKTVDASSGGLGGCNYAPGASGNVASEDVLYMLAGMKIKTGIDLSKLCEASIVAMKGLGRVSNSKFLQAYLKSIHS